MAAMRIWRFWPRPLHVMLHRRNSGHPPPSAGSESHLMKPFIFAILFAISAPLAGHAEELTLHLLALNLELDLLRQVALGDRLDHARDFVGWLSEVLNESVNRFDRGRPRACARAAGSRDRAFVKPRFMSQCKCSFPMGGEYCNHRL